MLGLITLVALAVWTILYQKPVAEEINEQVAKFADKLDKLWGIAHESLRDQKYLRAEKALLTILRVDERNATAYNRLGILYAKQRAYQDAIECFEIAQSLEPSASSLHNVGLIYYETQKYEKAALAFEQALAMQDDLAARHIAYAKVQEKLGHTKKMIAALEKAVELEPSTQSLSILAEAYQKDGDAEAAETLYKKIQKLKEAATPLPAKVSQPPRRIVM